MISTYLHQLWAWAQANPAAAILYALGASTVITPRLHRWAVVFSKFTGKTKNRWDDGIAKVFLLIVDGFARLVAFLLGWLPQATCQHIKNSAPPPPNLPKLSDLTRSITGAVLVMAMGASTSGCGGSAAANLGSTIKAEAPTFVHLAAQQAERLVNDWAVPRYAAAGERCRAANPTDESAYHDCMTKPTRRLLGIGAGWQALRQIEYGLQAGKGRDEALACLPWAIDQIRQGVAVVDEADAAPVPSWVATALAMTEAAAAGFSGSGTCALSGGS